MPDDAEDIVTVRLAPKDREAIARLVEDGEFRNRSDFLRYAVKTALAGFGETNRARALDWDEGAIELPAAEPAEKRRRVGQGLRGMRR